MRVNNGDDLSTSCENLVNFGGATPEFTGEQIETFWTIYQN